MIDAHHPLLLGSASPRRRQILETLRIPLRQVSADVDESARVGEPALAYLVRVTRDKLAAVASGSAVAGVGAVLVADTAVVLGSQLLGKPRDDGEAAAMLRALSGRRHEVMTRFALASPDAPSAPAWEQTVVAGVEFRELAPEEVAGYVATGEGRDKAGAYAVQGIGAFAVRRIDGSYSCVVGLPACELVEALRRTGLLAEFPLAQSA